ncbi:MAG: HAD family hydrolase [Micromonosporaceae bacterium]
MSPELIASDLDGTLLGPDGLASPRTLAALERVSAARIPFVMVTGRPIRWLPEVLEQTGVLGPVVCANGAVIYDPETDSILAESPLDADVVGAAVAQLRREVPGVVCAVEIEQGRGMLRESGYRTVRNDINGVVVTPEELIKASAVKLLARLPDGVAEDFFARCTSLLDGAAQVTRSSAEALVEISAAGVTKASGLAWLAAREGVDPAQVLAYGDMPNDIPMLSWAGRGVAVGNAHPMVLEIADEITGAHHEDGLASHLEKTIAVRR